MSCVISCGLMTFFPGTMFPKCETSKANVQDF